MNKKQFTFIELLVVIAIMAILVSILLPSLHRAREEGKRAVCLSNIAQQARFIHLSSKDNNGQITLQHDTRYSRNAAYFHRRGNYINLGALWKNGMNTRTSINICPSWSFDEIPGKMSMGDFRSFFVKDNAVRIADRWSTSEELTDYQFRPEKNRDDEVNTVSVYGYVDKAIITKYLYGTFWGIRYHRVLVPTAYGDGSAKYVYDKSGSKFMKRAQEHRGDGLYQSKDTPIGHLWRVLDEHY